MGVLTNTSIRKRAESDQPFTSISKSQCPSIRNFDYSHVSKKPKVSSSSMNGSTPNRAGSSSSVSARLQLYPCVIKEIDREVHAPVRFNRFGFSAKKEDFGGGDIMGNFLMRNYEVARRSVVGSLRYIGKGKEVIDVDEEGDSRDENVGVEEDSSLEVVEDLEDGLEEERDLRKREKEEIVAKYIELDGKVGVEENPSSSSAVASGLTDGRLLKSLSLGGDVAVWDVDTSTPVYKKLYDTSNKKRSGPLNRIQYEISLHLKKLETLRLGRPAKKQEDVSGEAFLPLNEDEEKEVTYALSNAVRRKPLVTHENSNIQITGELLQCLRPDAWLNDEVINVYLELLKEREKREPEKYLKCHFFNTFFYKKLIGGRTGYDYKSVRRWTTQKKLGYCLYDCDKIFVPVHKEIHWCLAVINKKDGKFQYLDSLGGVDGQVMKVLGQYIVDEVKDKSGIDIDVTSWKQDFVTDLPQQENGFDCGMFMIKYMDFYSRDIGLCFDQEHMPYFRRRTVKEILRLKAD